MAAQKPEQEPEAIVEEDAPKRGALKTVVEDKLLAKCMSGDIWDLTEEEITSAKKTLDKFRGVTAKAYKSFDKRLTELRELKGSDYLKEVQHFRKPRKAGDPDSSLLDDLDY
jgi:hypothetical protein